jgi:hypothetical protein
MSYYRWPIGSDVTLFLELVGSNGIGVTGSDPHVMIRRYKTVDGSSYLDNYFWSGSGFTSTAFSNSMHQLDSTNNPGIYVYTFSQSLVQSASVYNVYYVHNGTPRGLQMEQHYFSLSGSGDVTVYESEVD